MSFRFVGEEWALRHKLQGVYCISRLHCNRTSMQAMHPFARAALLQELHFCISATPIRPRFEAARSAPVQCCSISRRADWNRERLSHCRSDESAEGSFNWGLCMHPSGGVLQKLLAWFGVLGGCMVEIVHRGSEMPLLVYPVLDHEGIYQ